MANWVKNTRTWLGLSNESHYDDYGDPDEYEDDPEEYDDRPVARPTPGPSSRSAVRSVPSGRSGPASRSGDDWDEGDGGVRVISAPAPAAAPEAPVDRGVVRPLPTSAKPKIVAPTGFNDVQQVADTFKRGLPVIINMQGVDRDLSRRLIDFASGLCYGLEGDMERVSDQVFLLTPRDAEVSDDDRRRLREGRLVDDAH